MIVIINRNLYWLIILSMFFFNKAFAESERSNVKMSITIQGDVVGAISAAQRDFSAFIQAQDAEADNLSDFLSDLRNYEVVVDEYDEFIKIKFFPKRYNGRAIKGGGGEYSIDKTNFAIITKNFYE